MWKFRSGDVHQGSCWPVAGSPISVAVRRVKLWRVDRGKDHFFSFLPPRKTLQFSLNCEASHFNVETIPKRSISGAAIGCILGILCVYWGGTFCGQEVPLHRVPWWNSFWEVPNDVDCWDWLLVENPKALIVLGITGSNRCRWVGLGNGHFLRLQMPSYPVNSHLEGIHQ